jgi:hypothetical protein
VLPSIELLVLPLNELDVIVYVINRRFLIESWRNVLSLLLFFRFCGGIKRISALTYDYFSSVVVLLLCIRPIDHAGGLCMSPILLYRENWVRIVLFLYRNRLMLCSGFRVNSLKFICTICLVVCKHIRSECNRFRKC